LNAIAAVIASHLEQVRADWWTVYRDTGLVNRWIHPGEPMIELRRRRTGALQIVSAHYDPDTGFLSLTLDDGRHLELPAGSGRME